MSFNGIINQFKLDADTVRRLSDVLVTATEQGDTGVADWVHVAMSYAVNGKLRDRDMTTLQNLEGTYNRDYYRNIVHVERIDDRFVFV